MLAGYWYSPGQPRIAVEIDIQAEGLHFAQQTWPYADLRFEWGGAETRLIEVHYQHQVLYCPEMMLLDDLGRYLSPQQYLQTQRILKAARPRRIWTHWLFILVAALLLTVALIWGAFMALIWARDLTISYIPADLEDKLAESSWQEMLQSSPVCDSPLLQDTLDQLDQRLSQGQSAYDLRYQVLRSQSMNALALPGGRIAIHAQLILETDSAEALAGVMAHEAEHVIQRHGLKSMINHLGIGLMVPVLLGDMGSVVVTLGAAGAEVLNLGFSRAQEQEADLKGLGLMHAAEINPQGMVDFFGQLQAHEQAAAGLELPAILSTHPLSEGRLQAVQAAISDLPGRTYPPLPIKWSEVQAAARACLQN